MEIGINTARLKWDLRNGERPAFDKYWNDHGWTVIPPHLLAGERPAWLEIGAGSGWFFVDQARQNPGVQLIAVERSRDRGTRLVRKAKKSGLENLAAFRGNAIPLMLNGVPSDRLDRIYILYPCPWVRNSQRKNRWYLHPMMRHLVRVLKPGGLLIWASDQKFYIDEAKFVSEEFHSLETLAHGVLQPNEYNDLGRFPEGRTKFEKSFLTTGQPCYELISRKRCGA